MRSDATEMWEGIVEVTTSKVLTFSFVMNAYLACTLF